MNLIDGIVIEFMILVVASGLFALICEAVDTRCSGWVSGKAGLHTPPIQDVAV